MYISEPLAAGIIYPTVLASWTYLARYGIAPATAFTWAVAIFFAFFLLSLLFIVWLRRSEIPRLEETLGLVGECKQTDTGVTSSNNTRT